MAQESVPRPPKPKSVGIWIRVSTEDQARGESPEHHERRARFYAESKEWSVREVYHLEAVSGKSVMGHAETQRMIGDIRSGRITGLIFSKLARLARNTKELLDFADIFKESDADLISLQEAIDTSTPAGRFFYTMIAAMAQWEREEIASRVAESVPIRAKLGKPLGGAAPFGYMWKDRQLVPDPREAPIRVRIYELFLEHRRKKTVARLLNEAGHRTRNGSEFSDTTIIRLLRDPTAKGVRRANYTKSLGDGKQWKLKPKEQWVETAIPAIVPEELWNRVNALLDEQLGKHARPTKRPVQLFAGVTLCTCGRKMYVPSWAPKYYCYGCKNKLPVETLEAIFYEELRMLLFKPREIERYLEASEQTIEAKSALLGTVEAERDRVRTEMEKVYRAYVGDQMSPEGFGRQYRPLEERLKQLDDQIPTLQGEIDFLRIELLSSSEVVSEAQFLHGRWPNLPFEEKRAIVENIVEKIVIGADDVAIHLRTLPVLSGGSGGGSGSGSPSSGRPRKRATQSHGFIDATSWKRAGKTARPWRRTTTMSPLSSGCRRASSASRRNSVSSSR